MLYLFVALLCGIGLLLVLSLVKYTMERWVWISPHFYYNTVGGVTALCSVTDFQRSKGIIYPSSESRGLVVVPETIAFRNSKEQNPHFVTEANHWATEYAIAGKKDLFVPFTSEAYLSFSEQEGIFQQSVNSLGWFHRWADEKVKENRKRSFLLRLAHRLSSEVIGIAIAWNIGVLVLLGIGFSIGVAVTESKSANQKFVTVTMTSPGQSAIWENRVTENSVLLVDNDYTYRVKGQNGYESRHLVWKGRVIRIQELGGGGSLACIEMKDEIMRCGFTDSSLRVDIGDIVYLRLAKLLANADMRGGPRTVEQFYWTITEQEAFALRDKANYAIYDGSEN